MSFHTILCALAAASMLVAAPAGAQSSPEQTRVPPGITMDSATAAAILSRQHLRSDTVAAFPIRRLADGVYAVIGDTGIGSEGRPNAGFIVTNDGVVVIDALGSPGQGEALLRTIRTVTRTPVRWLILTHHHPDHAFGAIIFRRLGARVIAHPDRHMLVNEDGDDRMVSDWTGAIGLRDMQGFALADTPDLPIRHDTTLILGGRRLTIGAASGAHTAGDITVWVPDARVLFAGDLLIEDGVTMVVDGNSTTLLAALARAQALDPRIVVPGHGRIPDDPNASFTETRCYLYGARARMREAVEQGTPMGRAIAQLPPADRDRPLTRASRVRRNAVRIYSEMEKALMSGQKLDPTEAEQASKCGVATSPRPA